MTHAKGKTRLTRAFRGRGGGCPCRPGLGPAAPPAGHPAPPRPGHRSLGEGISARSFGVSHRPPPAAVLIRLRTRCLWFTFYTCPGGSGVATESHFVPSAPESGRPTWASGHTRVWPRPRAASARPVSWIRTRWGCLREGHSQEICCGAGHGAAKPPCSPRTTAAELCPRELRRRRPPPPPCRCAHAPSGVDTRTARAGAFAPFGLNRHKHAETKRAPSPAWRCGRPPGGLAAAASGPGRATWRSGPGRRRPPGTAAGAIAEAERAPA